MNILSFLMQLVSFPGERMPFLIGVALVSFYFYFKKYYKVANIFVLANLFTILLVQILKRLIAEPRPLGALETGFGFPSQHTASYVVFWGILMITTSSKFLRLLGTLMILMVGISRVYLGEHWVIDVMGGYVIGFMVLGLSWWWISRPGLQKLSPTLHS